jgi:methionyl-tRNA formyltransferase
VHKLLIFARNPFFVPALLIKATLEAVENREDAELVGICIEEPANFYRQLYRYFQIVLRNKIISLFDSSQKNLYGIPWPININRLARRHNFQIFVPPEGTINHPGFINELKTEIKPTIALSYFCMQKFSPELLEVFEHSVNYHNGILPKYRGLEATRWSLYHGEKETGFAFHRMTENFDEGPILIEGRVPIKPLARILDLEYEKAIVATKYIPQLLNMLVNNDPGKPQEGESQYFTLMDGLEIRKIADPSQYSSIELVRRLKAFDFLDISINENWYKITKLETIPSSAKVQGRLSFRTSDGIIMMPTRFNYLPFTMYRTLNWIRRLRS